MNQWMDLLSLSHWVAPLSHCTKTNTNSNRFTLNSNEKFNIRLDPMKYVLIGNSLSKWFDQMKCLNQWRMKICDTMRSMCYDSFLCMLCWQTIPYAINFTISFILLWDFYRIAKLNEFCIWTNWNSTLQHLKWFKSFQIAKVMCLCAVTFLLMFH